MTARQLSSTALALGLGGLLLSPSSTRAQPVVSSVSAPVAGAVARAGGETVVCTGQASVTATAVTAPTMTPRALLAIDTTGVSCTGAATRARYVNTGVAFLTRPLATVDAVETTFALYQDTPNGYLDARTMLLALQLVYNPLTQALVAVTGTVGAMP